MPSDHEIRAAVKAMLREDPVVMGCLNGAEAAQLAIAALTGAEQARKEEASAVIRLLSDDPPAQLPDGYSAPLDPRTTVEMMADRDKIYGNG